MPVTAPAPARSHEAFRGEVLFGSPWLPIHIWEVAMKSKGTMVLIIIAVFIKLASMAQSSGTEAPAGFDTPTLAQDPGSKSVSNGIPEPAGDSFALDQQLFERREDPSLGLGPVYNAVSCSECHQNPVSGGPGQITELRGGHRGSK